MSVAKGTVALASAADPQGFTSDCAISKAPKALVEFKLVAIFLLKSGTFTPGSLSTTPLRFSRRLTESYTAEVRVKVSSRAPA